jgi:3-methyladenine DNA glycosylase AlkD
MMTQAVSWTLREMIKNHRDRVGTYLDANREILARHVVREIDNKALDIVSAISSSGWRDEVFL